MYLLIHFYFITIKIQTEALIQNIEEQIVQLTL